MNSMNELQNKYSKRIVFFAGLSLIWVFALLCTLIFFWEGQESFFLLWLFWELLICVCVIPLGIEAIILIRKERTKFLPFVFLLVFLIGSASLISGRGADYGTWPRFYLAKPYYDYKVKSVLATKSTQEAESICNGSCRINKNADGSFQQTIFPLGAVGSFFGWQAFVYDPVGSVIQSAKARQGDTTVEYKYQGRIYLGCALLSAKHLTGNWYFCSFWHD
jgi:hypothetical protein